MTLIYGDLNTDPVAQAIRHLADISDEDLLAVTRAVRDACCQEIIDYMALNASGSSTAQQRLRRHLFTAVAVIGWRPTEEEVNPFL